jgi:hypothetical protein
VAWPPSASSTAQPEIFCPTHKNFHAALDPEPPRPHWPGTKGQAPKAWPGGTRPSPARSGQSRGKFQGQDHGSNRAASHRLLGATNAKDSLRFRTAMNTSARRQHTRGHGPIRTSPDARTGNYGPVGRVQPWACHNFLYQRIQGRTFGAPSRPARTRLAEDSWDVHGQRERAGQCRAVAAGDVGDPRRRWLGSLAHFLLRDGASSRAAARRADAPYPAAARTRRNAPWVTRSASWPGRSSRAR